MKIRYGYLLAAYLMMVVFFTVYPSFSVHSYDKAFHMLEFFILAVLMLKTLEENRIRNPELLMVLIALPIVYFTEYAQLFIDSRTFSYKDMVANVAGILLAVGAKWVFSKR